jgi:hypothetical protein
LSEIVEDVECEDFRKIIADMLSFSGFYEYFWEKSIVMSGPYIKKSFIAQWQL